MATSNVKLPDLINRWIEVQLKGTDLERSDPLDIDVIKLTLLLKSMGLRLQYLDFDGEKSTNDNLTIAIKCNKSGMRAEMSYDLLRCSCPEKTERESAFWEVQATGPKVFSKFKNNTSSNLLPDVSESCALVSKAMLSNLLDFYEASIRQVKEEKERLMLHSPLKSPRAKVSVISPGLTIRNPFSTPPAEGKSSARATEEIERTNVVSKDAPMPESDSCHKPYEMQVDSRSNTSCESVGINNKTHELGTSENTTNMPIVDAIHSPQSHASTTDDNAFEAMKTLITSSPNEKPAQVPLEAAECHHDRDLNVINYLQQARNQIDMALMLMKLNTTQDISRVSTQSATPRNTTAGTRKGLGTPKFAQTRSSSLLSIEQRRPPTPAGTKKSTSSTSSQPSTPRLPVLNLLGRPDTPRPTKLHTQPVTALRKVISAMATGPVVTTRQLQPPGSLKKPTPAFTAQQTNQRKLLPPSVPSSSPKTLAKPVPSGRSACGIGLIQRSSSASYISKK
ncbi:uncharacterized protein LOC128721138 [Anopheles nili]|uniref:uncharacterized protein LOC128721138 n=1 Tax=Anopheles nili TaxID=185578 RepID=UPI00237BE0BC|nr:uncharacterized protein LOC128721138 [Anopheles nili]